MFQIFVCHSFSQIGSLCSHYTSRYLDVVGCRVDVLLCVPYSVLVTSRDFKLDARSSARDKAEGQAKRAVYEAGQGDAPRRAFPNDGDQ